MTLLYTSMGFPDTKYELLYKGMEFPDTNYDTTVQKHETSWKKNLVYTCVFCQLQKWQWGDWQRRTIVQHKRCTYLGMTVAHFCVQHYTGGLQVITSSCMCKWSLIFHGALGSATCHSVCHGGLWPDRFPQGKSSPRALPGFLQKSKN